MEDLLFGVGMDGGYIVEVIKSVEKFLEFFSISTFNGDTTIWYIAKLSGSDG